MNFTQSFRLALKSLMTSKMRALLTMLGIIIGVGAVIVITSLGNGMQQMMNQQFEQLGANLLQVQIYNFGGLSSRTVSPDDMYALVDKYPQYLSGVSPYVMTQGGPQNSTRTLVYYIYEQGFQSRNFGYACSVATVFFVIVVTMSLMLKRVIKAD